VFSTLIILVLYYILIYYGISKPLTKLMEQISRIKQGDYTEVPVVKTADELEEISKNINMLAVAVQTRENSLKQWQSKLEYLSTHDELTGLFNRRSFSIKLEYALKKAKRNQTQIAILFLDLDEFKQVNDTLGHTIGDNLLKAVAHRLETSLRESDVLARVGGDEFNIFVDGFKSIIELQTFAQKLLDDFTEPFVDVENEIVSSTSIGISLFPNDGEDVETLIKNADLAMYKAKENGKNSYSFYSSRFSEFLQHRMDIVQALKSAIKSEDEFVLHYQPKVSIQTQKVVGVEALIRWNSSELGFVRPDQFIKIAEETHMILDIGLWVLRKACEDFMFLKNNNCHIGSISVNVSSVQLEYGDMLQKVKDVITYTGISAEELELEVTESYIATHEKRAIETLTKFRNMGVALAIDDFGTGYSSMSYLQALPVTRLKIDKGFVDDLPDSKESTAIVNAIISLAETFGLKITVEGIEKEEQLNFFKGKYCDEIQGYFHSKPLPLKELQSFVKEMKFSELKVTTPYLELPELFYDLVEPTPLKKPYIIVTSSACAELLGVDRELEKDEKLLSIVNGTEKLEASTPFAMCYAGHQFGYFVPRLGDGRAINLGKVNGQNLQLKGSGLTLYSREGDGRAVKRSSIREFLMSEAMHGLGIETSRALAVIGSDTDVARERWEKGAIVLRVSPTWIRFGTFEYFKTRRKYDMLENLADYVIKESFPELQDQEDRYFKMFTKIVQNSAKTVARWQSIGFNHGVMNTDNMSIDGRTIDYGPYAMLDDYEANYICNHTDIEGRYSFSNQPPIMQWNLSILANALSPLVNIIKMEKVVEKDFVAIYEGEYLELMKKKMGLFEEDQDDVALLKWLLGSLQSSVLITAVFSVYFHIMTGIKKLF
ncbi:MAG: YdiU family protein, partial [Sulfurimonas sp.]